MRRRPKTAESSSYSIAASAWHWAVAGGIAAVVGASGGEARAEPPAFPAPLLAVADDDPFSEPARPTKFADEKRADEKKDAKDEKAAKTETKESKDEKTADKKPADAGAAATAAGPPPSAAKPLPDPEIIRLHLGDGSVVAGKLVLDELVIDTEFGRLEVPVLKVRSFTPGLESMPELDQRVAALVEALGGADFKARDAAQKELIALGPPIRVELQRREAESNAERKQRIRDIVAKLSEIAEEQDESADPAARTVWIRGDTVETDEFTVVGKIVQQSFTLESKYGTLSVRLTDIKNARRDLGIVEEQELRKSFAVEGQYIAQTQFKDSKIRVQRGDKISVTAEGKIVMSPWGSGSVTGPEGSSNYGTGSVGGQSFPGGTLVAKIGNNGKVFKVGSKVALTADADGPLLFGVVVHNSYARRGYSFPGQYDLKIKVDRQQAR
jgi:hypothetical protein